MIIPEKDVKDIFDGAMEEARFFAMRDPLRRRLNVLALASKNREFTECIGEAHRIVADSSSKQKYAEDCVVALEGMARMQGFIA